MEDQIYRLRRLAAERDEPEHTDLLDAAQALENEFIGAQYMRDYWPFRNYEEQNAHAEELRRKWYEVHLPRMFWDGFIIGLYYGRFPSTKEPPAPTYTLDEGTGQREHRVGYLMGYRRGKELLRKVNAFRDRTKNP